MSMRSIAQESRNFRDKLVRSILAPNKSKINILDYLQGCSVTAADWLRFDTWGGSQASWSINALYNRTVSLKGDCIAF